MTSRLYVILVEGDEDYQVDAVLSLLDGICDFLMACTLVDVFVVIDKQKAEELLKEVELYRGRSRECRRE